jgi:hypothetical protein
VAFQRRARFVPVRVIAACFEFGLSGSRMRCVAIASSGKYLIGVPADAVRRLTLYVG